MITDVYAYKYATMRDKPMCLYPFFHQLIKTNGNAMPCCNWDANLLPRLHHSEFFDSAWMDSVRESMYQDGVPAGCKTCVDCETMGGMSDRDVSHLLGNNIGVDLSSKPTVLSQEVNLSNICNLKCRMCDSSRSSKWIPDEAAIGNFSIDSSYKLTESGWTLANPDTIRHLAFLGGEPFMHQDQISSELSKIKQHGRLGEIDLYFNTNLTHDFDPVLLGLVLECGKVSINVSIDGYGPLNDYIRSDSEWDNLVENMAKLDEIAKKNGNILWRPVNTLTVFNCNRMHEMYEWFVTAFDTINTPTTPILAREPRCFSVVNLPLRVKHILLRDYHARLQSASDEYKPHWEALIGYLNHDPTMTEDLFLREFKKMNGKLDERRSTSLKTANPELYTWIEESQIFNNEMRFDLHDRSL